jgi:hypothetical protein
MNEEVIEIHCYVDQLIENPDGVYDKLGSAWFTVPKHWAEERIQLEGWKDIEEFFMEYTYDNVDGWLQEAVKEGVLIGCGTGNSGITTVSKEEMQ